MKKFLMRYDDAIKKYRSGEFGDVPLTLYDILSKVGEVDILEKMSLSEIRTLTDNSSGLLKQMFAASAKRKIHAIEKMQCLEDELTTLGIKNYCHSESVSDEDLAKKFNLEVIYCKPAEMSKDDEATLSPPENKKYFGTIKVLENANTSKFSYMHEIIHYLRDVGEGNIVSKTYTRKKRGKTDSPDEQDINYLTAATVMPLEQISNLLNEYETMGPCEEKDFISQTAQKYGQDEDAVLRRFIEVRNLVDYNTCVV